MNDNIHSKADEMKALNKAFERLKTVSKAEGNWIVMTALPLSNGQDEFQVQAQCSDINALRFIQTMLHHRKDMRAWVKDIIDSYDKSKLH